MGLNASRHEGSSWTRKRTIVPYIDRQILIHCTTRDVLRKACKWRLRHQERAGSIRDERKGIPVQGNSKVVTPELRMSSEQAQCPGVGFGYFCPGAQPLVCTGAIPSFLRLLGTLEEALPFLMAVERGWGSICFPFFQESTKECGWRVQVSSAKLSLIIIPSSSQEMALHPHRISEQDQELTLTLPCSQVPKVQCALLPK